MAYKLLYVLVKLCVYLSLSLADTTSCHKVAEGTEPCSDDEDKTIMECCLEEYKLGFDNLANYTPGEDPPSCAVDLDLAECLSKSRCFGKRLTNGLRLLILNQLVFTQKVKLCIKTKFTGLLQEAEDKSDAAFLDELKKIKVMEHMPPDSCATYVYGICGKQFKDELEKHPGYDPVKLCKVFIDEGSCIYDTANTINCDSQILKRFKANSNAAAGVVLSAICPPPPQKRELEEEEDEIFNR